MSESDSHNEVVQHEFTLQATAYAATPSIVDRGRISRLVEAVQPAAEARVLDVATGPGYVAMGFAERCRTVVGLDLTGAPLELAETMRAERGLTNLRLLNGDAERLPFADASFDVVVCRFAFHHFERPGQVLAEMARVVRPDGTVAVEDLITSEHPARAAYQNRFEKLRDPSHTRALPLSELLRLFAVSGLEVESFYADRLTPLVDRWLATTQTPAERAAEIVSLLERDEAHDLSGARPFRLDGALGFVQHTAAIIARKLASARTPV